MFLTSYFLRIPNTSFVFFYDVKKKTPKHCNEKKSCHTFFCYLKSNIRNIFLKFLCVQRTSCSLSFTAALHFLKILDSFIVFRGKKFALLDSKNKKQEIRHIIVRFFFKLAPHSKMHFENITRFTWRFTEKLMKYSLRTLK